MKIGFVLKKSLIVLAALVALVLILAYMSGAFFEKVEPGRVEAGGRRLGDLPIDVVHKVVQTQQVEVVGTIRAERQTEISARLMASIEEMPVRSGEKVSRGDLLVRLDDRDLQAQLERARQAVKEAEVNARNAEKDYERFKRLREQNVASAKEFDDALARHQAAQSQLLQSREAVSGAETMLSFTVIRAPADGVVVDRQMDVGDTAQPSRSIVTIYDPNSLRLEAAVPEVLASGLRIGDRLQFAIDTLPATSQNPLTGAVEEIVPQADTASRSVLVKVGLPKEIPPVVQGAFGRLLIPDKERVRLCLAQSAVKAVGQLRFVDVVREDETLERRQIKLGMSSPYGRVEVLSGLEPDEHVVLYGPPPQPLPEGVRLFGEAE
ncbi:efflux RND transporter periplasmic adaptor subunit [bacterium]|nr:efflux RND transporter periplasmic adaptor subunit [bacterium]